MTAPGARARCRHCGARIDLVRCAGSDVWVHHGPGGAFPCRDRRTGMCLPTQAAPEPAPTVPASVLAAVTIGAPAAPAGRYDTRLYHGRHRAA